jgi:hypothetical protein
MKETYKVGKITIDKDQYEELLISIINIITKTPEEIEKNSINT